MAYSGLDTLFQNMGPTFAAGIAGQREAIAQQDSELEQALQQGRLNKQQQDYSLAQQMNPLELQYKQGELAKQKAMLPGYTEDVLAKQLANQKTQATQASDISSTNSTNDLKVLSNRVKKMDDMSAGLGVLGAELQNVPAPARASYAAQKMQQLGYDLNDAQDAQHFAQLAADPATMPQKLLEFRNNVITQGSQYRQAMDVALLNAKNQKEIHAANNATQLVVAQLHESAADRRAAAKGTANPNKALQEWNKLSPEKRLGLAFSALNTNISPITGEEMSEKERSIMEGLYEQDQATINARLAATSQPGMTLQQGASGTPALVNKPVPTVGAKAAPQFNTTKSGAKYRIISE